VPALLFMVLLCYVCRLARATRGCRIPGPLLPPTSSRQQRRLPAPPRRPPRRTRSSSSSSSGRRRAQPGHAAATAAAATCRQCRHGDVASPRGCQWGCSHGSRRQRPQARPLWGRSACGHVFGVPKAAGAGRARSSSTTSSSSSRQWGRAQLLPAWCSRQGRVWCSRRGQGPLCAASSRGSSRGRLASWSPGCRSGLPPPT
jgi:hypothetical protein